VELIPHLSVLVSQKNYSRSSSGHTQDASFQFHLSPQQTHSIVASKYVSFSYFTSLKIAFPSSFRTGKISYGVQVQLR